MTFNVIQGPSALTGSGFVFDAPDVAALGDGDFAVTYVSLLVDFVAVFNSQAQLIASSQVPLTSFTDQPVVAAFSGGVALAWQDFSADGEIITTTFDPQTQQFSASLNVSNNTKSPR